MGLGEAFLRVPESGEQVTVVAGPQGGFHLLAGIRVCGIEVGDPEDPLSPDNPRVVFAVHDDRGQQLDDGAAIYRQGLSRDGEDATLLGRLVVLRSRDPSTFDGALATLSVEVREAGSATVLRDSVSLTLQAP